MQVLMPLASKSQFFKPEDYPFPTPLVEVGGKPMIERVIENVKQINNIERYTFVVLAQDISAHSLDSTLELLTGSECRVVGLRHPTRGALCSCLLAIDHIDPDQELIICNADQIIDANLDQAIDSFRAKQSAAGVISFPSVHPRWSYVRLDRDDAVIEAAEKRVISGHAIAGFYYFRTGREFIDAAMATIASDQSRDGTFYLSLALNAIILKGDVVSTFHINAEKYSSFYSPSKIKEFEDHHLLKSLTEAAHTDSRASVQVVIPAAGKGSRFSDAGFARPKPFIDINGKMMIELVLKNVRPQNSSATIIVRSDHLLADPSITTRLGKVDVQAIDFMTEGTACTIALMRSRLDPTKPLLIANSDQYLNFDVDDFVSDCFDRHLAGSIVVFKDAARNPKWSFAKIDENKLVVEVAEKKPISELATVGIYLFSKAEDFFNGALDMIARNDRVNNEFYTCPVYNYVIGQGLKIGVYEVNAHDMHGLGTPEDLSNYLSKQQSA